MADRQKKQGILRTIIQCLSFAFHNGYLSGWMHGKIYTGGNKAFCVPGLNCYSCPGAIGACPIGSLQAVLDGGGFRISLYVFGFIGAVGLLCGRFVCGWLCPFGFIQDLLHKIPFPKKIKNLPGHNKLRFLRYFILVIFVILLPMSIKNQAGVGQPWFCEYICPAGTLLGGIPLTAANASLRALIGPRFIWKLAILIAVIGLTVIADRPFCKYVCPLGALYGLANPVSLYRLKVDEESCVKCGACQKACGADIPVWQKPNSIDCIRCGKCLAACPAGALSSTFAGKSLTAASAKNPVSDSGSAQEKSSTAQTVRFAAAGFICALISGILIFTSVLYIKLVAGAAALDDFTGFCEYLLSYIMLLIPACMSFAVGILLIIRCRKRDKVIELHGWTVRTIRLEAICFVLNYLMYLAVVVLLAGAGSYIFATAALLMAVGAAMYLVLLLALFAAWALTLNPAEKKTGAQAEPMKETESETASVSDR